MDKEKKISLDTFAINGKKKLKGHMLWVFSLGFFCQGASLDCSSTELQWWS